MSDKQNKMLQRSSIIAILSKYKQNDTNPSERVISKDIKAIKSFKDVNFSIRLIIAEMTKPKSKFNNICAFFLVQCFEPEILETNIREVLEDNKTAHKIKFFLISILKQIGVKISSRETSEYIESSDEIARDGVKEFLDNAISDAEVQIDLVDFYLNVSIEEKLSLLNNIVNEFESDKLANALSLIAQLPITLQEAQFVYQGLIKTQSPYAINGINALIKTGLFSGQKLKKLEVLLKEIKFANPNPLIPFFIKDSVILKSFISYVDGCSNFSLVFSRKIKSGKDKDKIDAMFIVINTSGGIVSVTGFSKITQESYAEILRRLYVEFTPSEINPLVLKKIIQHYLKVNEEKNNVVPYEYIVWKQLLDGIPDVDFSYEDCIKSNYKKFELSQESVDKYIKSPVSQTWFYVQGQNKIVDDLIEKIEQESICQIEKINDLVKENALKMYEDNEFLQNLKINLELQGYISSLAELSGISKIAYNLAKNEEYLKVYVESIINRSLADYFINALKIIDNGENNVFAKTKKTGLTKEQLIKLIVNLEEK